MERNDNICHKRSLTVRSLVSEVHVHVSNTASEMLDRLQVLSIRLVLLSHLPSIEWMHMIQHLVSYLQRGKLYKLAIGIRL